MTNTACLTNDGVHWFDEVWWLILANVIPGVALPIFTPLLSMMPTFGLCKLLFPYQFSNNNNGYGTSAPFVNTAASVPGRE